MKYGLLAVSTPPQVNIGDYIQAVAARQFLPAVDEFIEREELSDYTGEDIAMIMNAWYIHNPKKWPPSKNIIPLYVAVHINKQIYEDFSTKDNLQTFCNTGMVGCRDKDTLNFFVGKGISAYFSGCLTLTLGYKYHSTKRGDTVYFVDPVIPNCRNLHSVIKYSFLSVLHLRDISIIFKKKYSREKIGKRSILLWAETSCFYSLYSKRFKRGLLLDAEYITQQSPFYKQSFTNNWELLEEAERLVKLYSCAKFVVTSRIHCALPCTGLETPVIYVYDEKISPDSKCRLNGLLDLFNIINLKENGELVNGEDFMLTEKISSETKFSNPNKWRPLAQDLIEKCEAFINSFSKSN